MSFEKKILEEIIKGRKLDSLYVARFIDELKEEDPNKIRKYFLHDRDAAYAFAYHIEGPHDETRKVCLGHTAVALSYAKYIDQGPRDDTREVTCSSIYNTLEYAIEVDKGPHELTRRVCCESFIKAYFYAVQVDKGPHELTRAAVCRDPEYAFLYAKAVEKELNEDLYNAVKGTRFEKDFLDLQSTKRSLVEFLFMFKNTY